MTDKYHNITCPACGLTLEVSEDGKLLGGHWGGELVEVGDKEYGWARARIKHKCWECERVIEKGERHLRPIRVIVYCEDCGREISCER